MDGEIPFTLNSHIDMATDINETQMRLENGTSYSQ